MPNLSVKKFEGKLKERKKGRLLLEKTTKESKGKLSRSRSLRILREDR